jgi:transcriptional regulator with XRE-family HTH domain
MVITAAQCRGARAMLGWSQDQLSEAAAVAKKTVADFEIGNRTPYARTLGALQVALEAAGIEFIPENGGGAGVRLRQRSTSHIADPQFPEMRSVGPEDEDRAGPGVPEGRA